MTLLLSYTCHFCPQGCLFARGDLVLFADADGATDINSLERVIVGCRKNTKNGLCCAIGSRYEEESHAQVSYSLKDMPTIIKDGARINKQLFLPCSSNSY